MSLLEAGSGGTERRMPSSRHALMRRRDQERLLIVNGHPDPRPDRFCAALCQACLTGATAAGRDADTIALGGIFPANGLEGAEERSRALDLLRQPARLIVIFPLWLDGPPEIVTHFFDQVQCGSGTGAGNWRAHLVVTMSLPAFARRSLLRQQGDAPAGPNAMSLPGLQIDALNFVGSVDTISLTQREEWLHRLRRLGSGKA